MKTFLFSSLTLFACLFFSQTTLAQAADQATFEKFLEQVFTAYENGDDNAVWNFYTDDAAEITPDGMLTSGKQNLKAGWDSFMKMVDSKPSFTYELTSWRLINPDVAIVTWNSNADIKMQGQQIGGPTNCVAVLRKVRGNWLIEFDGMTPVMQMPTGN